MTPLSLLGCKTSTQTNSLFIGLFQGKVEQADTDKRVSQLKVDLSFIIV